MTDKILVLTTAGSKDEARKIGRALVERLLAACVNVVPQVGSIYRWEGEIEEAEEWLLIVKTTQAAFERVRESNQEASFAHLEVLSEVQLSLVNFFRGNWPKVRLSC